MLSPYVVAKCNLTMAPIENTKNVKMEVTCENYIPKEISSRLNSDNSYHQLIRVFCLLVSYNKEYFKLHCGEMTM